MSVRRILILGGYGNFGKRIVSSLCDCAEVTLIIAGRNKTKADALRDSLSAQASATLISAPLDLQSPDLVEQLKALQPDLLVHFRGRTTAYRKPVLRWAATT